MKHIKKAIDGVVERASKAKFYRDGQDIFLRYFDSLEQYNALILAGNFRKMEGIIKVNSAFDLGEFVESLKA